MSVGVTDHALVRWLQRTGAMDMETMRAMLAASLARAAEAAEGLGGGYYLVLADGLVFVIDEGKCVTVLEDDGRHGRQFAAAENYRERRQRPKVKAA